jgi:Protein of unknown function (DUF3102)
MTSFDYGDIDVQTKQSIENATSEIKILFCRTAANMIEIGLRLKQIKSQLTDRTWLRWLNSEFVMGERTAQHYMRAATVYSDCLGASNFNVSMKVLRELSSVDNAEIVSASVNSIVSSGEILDDARALKLIESKGAIVVGNTIEVTGTHSLKGQMVTIVEVDGPLTTVEIQGVQVTLLPLELGLEGRDRSAATTKSKPNYLQGVQSRNALLSEEVEELRDYLRQLLAIVKSGLVIPRELMEVVENVVN